MFETQIRNSDGFFAPREAPSPTPPAPPDRRRDAWVIGGYFLAVLVLGAALAPPLFWGGRTLVGLIESFKWTQMPVFGFIHHHVGKADFTRFFNRAILVAAIACLWPATRFLRIRRGELGLRPNPARWLHLGVGFLAGAGLLLAMGLFYLAADAFVWKKSIAWGSAIRESLVRAAGAGILEEWFFRGALLGLMLRASSPRRALLFVTTVFAAVHFLQAPEKLVIRDGVEWGTGFWLIGQILGSFADANFILAEFATLWVAGWILGMARLRTGSLWLSIGLHSGWIFGIGLFAAVARASKAVARDQWLPWIGETLKSGLVPLAVLALTGAALAWLDKPAPGSSREAQTDPNAS